MFWLITRHLFCLFNNANNILVTPFISNSIAAIITFGKNLSKDIFWKKKNFSSICCFGKYNIHNNVLLLLVFVFTKLLLFSKRKYLDITHKKHTSGLQKSIRSVWNEVQNCFFSFFCKETYLLLLAFFFNIILVSRKDRCEIKLTKGCIHHFSPRMYIYIHSTCPERVHILIFQQTWWFMKMHEEIILTLSRL